MNDLRFREIVDEDTQLQWGEMHPEGLSELLAIHGRRALEALLRAGPQTHEGHDELEIALDNRLLNGNVTQQLQVLSEEMKKGGRVRGPHTEMRRVLTLPGVRDKLTRTRVGTILAELGLESSKEQLRRREERHIDPTAQWVLAPRELRPVGLEDPQWTMLHGVNVRTVSWTKPEGAPTDLLTFSGFGRAVMQTESNEGRFWIYRERDPQQRKEVQRYLDWRRGT